MSLLMGIPSTTNRAVFLSCDSEPSPRSVTRIDPPGPDEVPSRLSPATLPAIELSQLLETVEFSCSLFTFETA